LSTWSWISIRLAFAIAFSILELLDDVEAAFGIPGTLMIKLTGPA
jgi:hypothetical protein